jgi:hypothetical protein
MYYSVLNYWCYCRSAVSTSTSTGTSTVPPATDVSLHFRVLLGVAIAQLATWHGAGYLTSSTAVLASTSTSTGTGLLVVEQVLLLLLILK